MKRLEDLFTVNLRHCDANVSNIMMKKASKAEVIKLRERLINQYGIEFGLIEAEAHTLACDSASFYVIDKNKMVFVDAGSIEKVQDPSKVVQCLAWQHYTTRSDLKAISLLRGLFLHYRTFRFDKHSAVPHVRMITELFEEYDILADNGLSAAEELYALRVLVNNIDEWKRVEEARYHIYYRDRYL